MLLDMEKVGLFLLKETYEKHFFGIDVKFRPTLEKWIHENGLAIDVLKKEQK